MPDEPIIPAGGNPPQPGDDQNKNIVPPLDQEIQTRDAQIAHWRDKATKLEDENKKLRPAEVPPAPANDQKPVGVDPFEAVRLGKALADFDESETDFIIRNSKTKNVEDIIKASQDEYVQLAIKSRREKVAKENKIPSPSNPGGGFAEKSALEISQMTREQHMAYEKEVEERNRSNGGI